MTSIRLSALSKLTILQDSPPNSSNPNTKSRRPMPQPRSSPSTKKASSPTSNNSSPATQKATRTTAPTISPRTSPLAPAISSKQSATASRTKARCLPALSARSCSTSGKPSRGIHEKYRKAIESARPLLDTVIGEWDMERHFGSTPLVSKEHWDEFMGDLPVFGGEGC